MVKRWLLLVLAGISFCLGAAVFCLHLVFFPQLSMPTNPAPIAMASALHLPYSIPGTGLVVVDIAIYDGLYLEDGSCEEVTQVTALVLRNDGEVMVGDGSVHMLQAGRELKFSFSYLPSGSTVLVLDENRTLYAKGEVTWCTGSATPASEDAPGIVTMRENGMTTLLVSNPGPEKLQDVTIYFKNFDPDSQMFLGGIAYEINIHDLMPGQTQVCNPWYYISGQSKIVKVKTSGTHMAGGFALITL